ncbi:hypothetical protein [Paludibacter sp.]|uniref:hypothetical protein n=1 Tax=Paludibacter sp. TaxID=1898105 RepID=UPI0025D7F1E3|nr:hypothetical protein [Paludibacter sp.]
MNKKVKIVIDSDVIIHFIKGEELPILHQIFPQYQYVILDIVVNQELNKNFQTRQYLERYTQSFKGNISIIKWSPTLEMTKEFAFLRNKYGLGESASMVYCKYNQDVIASSNITEITDYCNKNDIQYVTTMDLLYRAFKNSILTEIECDEFITKVISGGSKLPVTKISQFRPRELYL